MPYIIRPPWRIQTFVATLLGAVLLAVAAPAVAGAACPASKTTLAFEKFGDTASYTLVEGGLFESGAVGWVLNSAEVVGESPEEENPGYGYISLFTKKNKSHSLKISDWGEAVSSPFCVSSEYPSFRFLQKERDGFGVLDVSLRWTDASGTHETEDAKLTGTHRWQLSPVLELAGKLPEGTTNGVRLVFRPRGASWAIDDIYIDPYTR
jgi:hypothetical protein